ncbi:MAG: hypothetical protein BWY88_01340 [Synergistetes bacterium ADurb.Bin520]|nr:MAG: hypothetical protein BWY88_01340 [Synergistetes bacterium ADurb.Bin520]
MGGLVSELLGRVILPLPLPLHHLEVLPDQVLHLQDVFQKGADDPDAYQVGDEHRAAPDILAVQLPGLPHHLGEITVEAFHPFPDGELHPRVLQERHQFRREFFQKGFVDIPGSAVAQLQIGAADLIDRHPDHRPSQVRMWVHPSTPPLPVFPDQEPDSPRAPAASSKWQRAMPMSISGSRISPPPPSDTI